MQPRFHLTEGDSGLGDSLTAEGLDQAVAKATAALEAQQRPDGHWVYELEADCTIPAEYILMTHFTGEVDEVLEQKIARYLRARQAEHGGWPLYTGGDFDLSCTVKVYYALKIVGDDIHAPHMARARNAILNHGGAAHANVFTRITLALFQQVPWRAVPFIPVEIMHLPRWFPFHLGKVSYWSRVTMVPLFVLCSLKPAAANPRGVDIRELFVTPPEDEQHYYRVTTWVSRAAFLLDQVARTIFEPNMPRWLRQSGVRKCVAWFTERLNGEDGLGAIFPAMVNAHEVLQVLGYAEDHPFRQQTRDALRKLLVVRETDAYCQPCLSPVWDTVFACYALFEAHGQQATPGVRAGLDWLKARQLPADAPGDWRDYQPDLPCGGWGFEYNNPHYPDLDDTSMVAWTMEICDRQAYRENIDRACVWIAGMQSRNGGFASFDANNTYYYLNNIPFADHGALLDPPTADVTARCVALLGIAAKDRYAKVIRDAMEYIQEDQEEDGSWFGRWGTNYVYGTWSVLSALEAARQDMRAPFIRRAVAWLKDAQNADGGWGESNDSYYPPKHRRPFPSTPFQTAWAVLGLMAAGDYESLAVTRGVQFLVRSQAAQGLWEDKHHTAPGFPRVFYLRYHGYTKYFPLWALARFRNHHRAFPRDLPGQGGPGSGGPGSGGVAPDGDPATGPAAHDGPPMAAHR
jgi:squalene-hopene/tetraprenyl-beta-curcumene cyclase